jgi:manganese transport protein
LPFAIIPLVLFSRRQQLMGALVNRRLTTATAILISILIISLNAYLLYDTIWGG